MMHLFIVLAALTLSSALANAAVAADGSGEQIFNNACRTCHSWKKDDNRLGPTLHGVVGQKAGTVPGYVFSQAMKTSGITWDEATLDKFIAQPDSVVPNNNMKPFTGISDAGQRKQIIEFLKTNPN